MVRVDGSTIVPPTTDYLENHPRSTKIMREVLEEMLEKYCPKSGAQGIQHRFQSLPEALELPERLVPKVPADLQFRLKLLCVNFRGLYHSPTSLTFLALTIVPPGSSKMRRLQRIFRSYSTSSEEPSMPASLKVGCRPIALEPA